MEKIKCIGCGSTLQSENEKIAGFVNQTVLDKGDDNILCKRCFRLKHYNEINEVDLDSDEFTKILTQIGNEDALIVNVVDIFDLSGSIIPGISRYVGDNEIILVGNKRDVLPKAIKDHRIVNWMRRISKDYGYKVIDATLISAKKGHGIDDLLDMVETYRKGRNVYIVGCTNVGKSTLINSLIKQNTELLDDVVTVSQFPGTTLGLIEIPIDDKHYLIDTPGIINKHQYSFYLDPKNLKHVLPTKEIKPKVYQLNPKQTLYFDGLARFDFVEGDKAAFVCHFSNEVNIHRTKLENASSLFEKHIGDLLSPPSIDEYKKLGEYKKHQFRTPDYKCDIVISGLGYITINQKNIKIVVHAPEHVGVFLRASLL